MFRSLVFLLLCGATSFGNVEWEKFDSGVKRAAKEKKYVFLDFYADWCSYCKVMDSTTYRNSAVLHEIQKNFVPVKIDTEGKDKLQWKGQSLNGEEFSAVMGISSLPTLVFLNSKGEIIGSYPSFADENLMINLLTYVSSGSREKNISLDEYLERLSQ